MTRRWEWLLCLLALPSIAGAVNFCRTYTITQDTYFDYANPITDYSSEIVIPMKSNVSTDDQYFPFTYLAAPALLPGETFDSATLVVYTNFSPIVAGTYNVYRILGAVANGVNGATWYSRDLSTPWGVAGCQLPGSDHYAAPVFTGTSWTGSRDSVEIASGVGFSTFVQNYVLGSSQYIVMRFDGTTPTAYCQWYSSDGATAPKLRIYGHRGAVTSSRRRSMYAQP
jgi:hypothetical protein